MSRALRRATAGSWAVAVALAVVTPYAHADTQLWSEVGVRHQFDRHWRISFDQLVRFDDDVSRLTAVMPQAGLVYRAASWLRVGTGYRFSYRRDGKGEFVVRHRVYADAGLRSRWRKQRLRLAYRLRFQEEVRSNERVHTWRNRAGVSWRLSKRMDVQAQYELFTRLGGEDGTNVHKQRFTIGATVELGFPLKVFVRIDDPIADELAPIANIFGIGYHIQL